MSTGGRRRRAGAAGGAATLLLLAASACTTAYEVRPRAQAPRPSATGIGHCLASQGFQDVSTTPLWAPALEMDRRDGVDPPRSAVWHDDNTFAHVHTDGSVVFTPNAAYGAQAELLSRGFARCLELHEPDAALEIEGHRFFDLR